VVETDGATSSYAASLMYDETHDRIYLTGSTYGGKQSFFHVDEVNDDEEPGVVEREESTAAEEDLLMSDCFIGILQIPRGDRAPEWLRRVAIGVPDQSESCSDLFTYRNGNDRKLLLAGHVIGGTSVLGEQQEMFASTSTSESTEATVSGMVLDLTWYAEIKGGYLLDHTAVQYPITLVADDRANTDEDIYVASLLSSASEVNPAFTRYQENDVDENVEELDLTTSGGYLPPAFGSQYSVLLQRLGRRLSTETEIFSVSTEEDVVDRNSSETSSGNLLALKAAAGMVDTTTSAQSFDEYRYVAEPLQEKWEQEFAADGSSVQVSSMLHRNSNSSNVVIFAGSTRSSGFGLGEATDNSMSGFITVVDANYGVVLRNRRVSSGSTSSDHILGLCQDKNNNLYAVGMSNGELNPDESAATRGSDSTFQAFIQKMDSETLRVIWTRELAAETDASHPGSIHGMACAVTPDGSHVYLAGTVKAGASITLNGRTTATKSAGHDDIFVAQYNASDGALRFVKQLGTNHNDQLAAGQGVVCDKYGNAILLANTQGSFLNPSEKVNPFINDVVVLSIDRINGDHADLTQQEDEPKRIPTPRKKHSSGKDKIDPPSISNQKDNATIMFDSDGFKFLVMLVLFAIALLGTFVALAFYICRRRNSQQKSKAVDHYMQSMNSDNDSTVANGRFHQDYDPECANMKKELDDVATTDVDDEDDYYFQDAASEFTTADEALLPLSSHSDEGCSKCYQDSLRRLQEAENDEPAKNNARKRSDATVSSAFGDDKQSLLPAQDQGDDQLERWLKNDR